MITSLMNRCLFSIASLAMLLCFTSGSSAQDSVQLHDGRFVLDQKMVRTDKGVMVHFPHGDVFLSDGKIHSTTATFADGSRKEVSAADQAKLDKGLVFFNGKWMSVKSAEKAQVRLREKRKKNIEEALKHRKWKGRYFKKSKHFAFEFTISPDVMKGYSAMLETYYKVFTKQWNIKVPPRLGRLKVCFYHDADTFHQVSGARQGTLAYFRFVTPIELDFYYDRMDADYTYAVMFHEANHYLTYLISPKFMYPRWINEGMAEYYGASKWDPKKKKMSIGHIQEGRLAVIRDETMLNLIGGAGTSTSRGGTPKWMGLEDLIDETKNGIQARHYAWAWSFIHFMFHGENKKYATKFKKFFIALARDKKIERTKPDSRRFRTVTSESLTEALKRYLGVDDFTELDKEWHNYIRGLKATGHRGKMMAGRFALNDNMPIKAMRLLQESLDGGNENPLCYYYLAEAQYDKDLYAKAELSYRKLIEMDPLIGMAYVRLARCREKQDAPDEEVARWRQLAGEVEPDNFGVAMEILFDEEEAEDEEEEKE